MPSTHRHAHFDKDRIAIVITDLTVRDKDVVREAQRWTSGARGPVIDDPAVLDAAELTEFVTEAVTIGAHALSAAGQAQDSRALERMLKDVGDKAADSSNRAAEHTDRTVKEATAAIAKAAQDAKKAIVDADETSRKEFTKSVAAAKTELSDEVRSLLGGEHPELLDRLQPLLDKFGASLDAKSTASINEVVTKAVKQFDPSDPTSPMAKHAAELETRQVRLTEQIDKNHDVVIQRIDDITTALKVQEARSTLTRVTPIKGDTFENQVNVVLSALAAGLGEEYTDTRSLVGAVPRSKKGDGVLTVNNGAARVVVEMTDSVRAGWTEYLDEAERNRHAGAALGLVRTAEQNGNQTIRMLGARRVVLAFDPTCDDPDLVRTVVMLLRASALTAVSRRGGDQLDTAEEKITEAITQLDKLDDIKKAAGSIHKSADKIESSCTGINSSIQRLLAEALAALESVEEDAAGNPTAVA